MARFKTYGEWSKFVNDTYKDNGDIRETMKETGLPFDEVWEMTGFKDWFDFVEGDKDD